MTSAVSAQLERRAAEQRAGGRRWATGAALLLHGLLAVGILGVAESRRMRKPTFREYAPVVLLPAARLGVERQAPPAPSEAPKAPAPATAPAMPAKAVTPPARQDKPRREAAKKAIPDPAPAPTPGPIPQGQSQGAPANAAFGAASVQFDQVDFTYGYYVDQMLSLISAHWIRPPVGSGVEAVVSFRIDRTGRVSDLRISRSSGINSFDLAALRAVQSASPLPPLPRAFREGSLGVHLIVR